MPAFPPPLKPLFSFTHSSRISLHIFTLSDAFHIVVRRLQSWHADSLSLYPTEYSGNRNGQLDGDRLVGFSSLARTAGGTSSSDRYSGDLESRMVAAQRPRAHGVVEAENVLLIA